VTFKFWELLKNASEVILVPKNIFFLKILNLVQSFVECKESLADGTIKVRGKDEANDEETHEEAL
jgi:hypothetical protein